MRHRRAKRKLSRNTSNRIALLRSLARAIIISERISTTYDKAKEASSLTDRLITLGKKNSSTSRKTAISILGSKELINRLFDDIAPRFSNRKGGYTRVLRLQTRRGDGAQMAILELTEQRVSERPSKATVKKEEKEKDKVRKTLLGEERVVPEKEAQKEAKPSALPPKAGQISTKEKLQEEKGKERAKSEQEKLQKGFFKGLRRYFRRKTI